MAQTTIPTSVKDMLWARSAGRCAYEGCNQVLWQDILTKRNYNQAYIAHIIADDPHGPRGHPELSSKLGKDYNNLMLLCDRHHRLIEKVDVVGHTVERLYAMKLAHEERIDRLTSVQEDKRSDILLYSANVGLHNPVVSYELARETIAPAYYPARSHAFELSSENNRTKAACQVNTKTLKFHLRAQSNILAGRPVPVLGVCRQFLIRGVTTSKQRPLNDGLGHFF